MSKSKPAGGKGASKSEIVGSEDDPEWHPHANTHGVIVSTMNDIPGYRVLRVLGTVYGMTVRTRNWGADIGAFLKSSVGGELKYFTTLVYRARDSAVERMVGECMGKGGNAIIAMRFDTTELLGMEVCAYGTACVVEKIVEREAESGPAESSS
jgi:uncharacterized protein YbjQ (UPF0145 family)